MKTYAYAFAALCAAMLGAQSGSAQSGFIDTPPVEAEVIDGWTLPDGRRMAALRLTLAPGWKTYWRAPGDAGIPPQFDWSRARNVQDVSVDWPTPEAFREFGMRSLGYKNEVVLPLTIAPKRASAPIRLRGRMVLGVCAEVCLPHELDLDATIGRTTTTSPDPSIVAALATLPYSQDEAEVKEATCRMTPTEDGLQISAAVTLPHTGGEEISVIEPGVPNVWVSETQTSRRGETLTATSEMIHIEDVPFTVNRSDVRITIIGSDYAVDVKGCSAG